MTGLSLRLQFEWRWVCFAEINPLICGNITLWLIYKDFSVFESVPFSVSLCAQLWTLQDEHPCSASLQASVPGDLHGWRFSSASSWYPAGRRAIRRHGWGVMQYRQYDYVLALSTLRTNLMQKYFFNVVSQCIHNHQHMSVLHNWLWGRWVCHNPQPGCQHQPVQTHTAGGPSFNLHWFSAWQFITHSHCTIATIYSLLGIQPVLLRPGAVPVLCQSSRGTAWRLTQRKMDKSPWQLSHWSLRPVDIYTLLFAVLIKYFLAKTLEVTVQ